MMSIVGMDFTDLINEGISCVDLHISEEIRNEQQDALAKEKKEWDIKRAVQYAFSMYNNICYGEVTTANTMDINVNGQIITCSMKLARKTDPLGKNSYYEIDLALQKGSNKFKISLKKYTWEQEYKTNVIANIHLLRLMCQVDVDIKVNKISNCYVINISLDHMEYKIYMRNVEWYNAEAKSTRERLEMHKTNQQYMYNASSGYYESITFFDKYWIETIQFSNINDIISFCLINVHLERADIIKKYESSLDTRSRCDFDNGVVITRATRANSIVWKTMGLGKIDYDDIVKFEQYISRCNELYLVDNRGAISGWLLYGDYRDPDYVTKTIFKENSMFNEGFASVYWWYKLWKALKVHREKYGAVLSGIKCYALIGFFMLGENAFEDSI